MQIVQIFDVSAQLDLLDHDVNGVRNEEFLHFIEWMIALYIASVCSINTCQNGGTCRQVAPTMAECLCQTGFTGSTCSLR